MDRFDFSAGHIFMKTYPNVTYWTIFMNGAGNCGGSGTPEKAIEDILNHWKMTKQIRTEVESILKNRKQEFSIGEQLELF